MGSGDLHVTKADQSLCFMPWRSEYFGGGRVSSARPKESILRFCWNLGIAHPLSQEFVELVAHQPGTVGGYVTATWGELPEKKPDCRKAERRDGETEIPGDI